MKIRNDFVSNSSSSSFIVELDETCLKNLHALALADGVYALATTNYYDEKYFDNDLLHRLYLAKIAKYDETDTSTVVIDMKKLLLPENSELLKELLQATSMFEVEHGNDCDEQYEFYGYAAWLTKKGFKLHDSDNSSMSLFDLSIYDDKLLKYINSTK